jgi:hypothetical protein
MKKQFRNIKELPGCPIGRIFKQDVSGDYYHSMSDDEAINGEFQTYEFPLDIMENTQWFAECNDNFIARIYNPKNIDEYTDIDTGIPNILVDTIEKVLKEMGDTLSPTPKVVLPETYDISWGIIESEKNGSRLKYRVTIDKYNAKI